MILNQNFVTFNHYYQFNIIIVLAIDAVDIGVASDHSSVTPSIILTIFPQSGTDETQRLFGDVDDDDDGSGSGGGGDYGVDGDGDRGGGPAADDGRPDGGEPFDAVAGETVAVVDAAERIRGGRLEVFEKGVQDDDGGQQPVHHIQGEQGEPEEAGKVVGSEGEESHQDSGHSFG